MKKKQLSATDHLQFYIALLRGLNRTLEAQNGTNLANLYFLQHRSSLPGDFDSRVFDYVVRASLLVYGVSTFDVFLSDLTRDLLLRDIAVLGKSCVVPIEVLASQKARNAIIKREVERKVRNIAYKNFEERIAIFGTLFGISVKLSGPEIKELKRISDLRNRLVHDQSLHHFRLDRHHRLIIQEKKNVAIPVPVGRKELVKANKLFLGIGKQFVEEVDRKVFGNNNLTL